MGRAPGNSRHSKSPPRSPVSGLCSQAAATMRSQWGRHPSIVPDPMTHERCPHPRVDCAISRLFARFGLVHRLVGIRPMPTRWRMLVRFHAGAVGLVCVRADVATLVLLFLLNAFVMCDISGVSHAAPPQALKKRQFGHDSPNYAVRYRTYLALHSIVPLQPITRGRRRSRDRQGWRRR
jgi:hypothetical protein